MKMTNLDHLCLNSIGMDDEAAKILGGAIGNERTTVLFLFDSNGKNNLFV